MPNVATWMRARDKDWFARAFAPHPEVHFWNAFEGEAASEEADGLLLTGGADIAPQFLAQDVPDESLIKKDPNPARDLWEFAATKAALDRGIPIFAICKGLQVFNVTLGGTLRLDIPGHDAPEMKDHDVQPLRWAASATHSFDLVNSSHHQAIDRLADGCEVEAWCVTDDIIEQIRLTNYPFARAVQYHPERGGERYAPLFAEFVRRLQT
ncbi:MAG TPA: gamma-glutamyl-gamma-aminobutyrate hydrolase family protein [Chthoniobacterales bacterium]|nr:gamma-glutamyl-gamma-aminobutyrate hydrolase family protein [Chthoniobacterales bacterium]